MLDTQAHPGICQSIYKCMKRNTAYINGESWLLSAFPYLLYNKICQYRKVSSENIYIVTDKIYQTFAQMPLPDITFRDIKFRNDTPALFIFDNFNTVAHLDFYSLPFMNRTDFLTLIFDSSRKQKYYPNYFLMYTDNVPEDLDIPISELVEKELEGSDERAKENVTKYAIFFYNLLFFLSQKETIKYHSQELNDKRLVVEKNISLNINVKRNKTLLKQIPSYRFIDLELTLDNYSKEYYLRHPIETDNSRAPHWRSAHWHSYWIGKKDGTEERKKVLRFIPTVWVGNPELITEQTTFKVIK
jgi:hypothetical protein